jgi:hypothetical protein
MRDSDIRLALDTLLRARYVREPETIIRHEVGLCEGKRRIDVIVVNSELCGYEIKSDEDTLKRLLGQAETYGQVLDRATLVTTGRHTDHALAMLPNWWGIIVARTEHGHICLDSVREPALNSQHIALSLAQLLWREEALEELRLRNKSRGLSNKARYYLWVALTNALSLDELRSVVCARLKARPAWPGGQLHAPYGVTSHTP